MDLSQRWWSRPPSTVRLNLKFWFAEPVSRFGQRLEIQDLSLDIENKKNKPFDSWVLISRLELRLSNLESWYRDWNRDFWDHGGDIETGIETQKTGGDPCDRDSCETTCSSLIWGPCCHYLPDWQCPPILARLAHVTCHVSHVFLLSFFTKAWS